MPIRREVLGPEYVDASMARADEFMMSFQRATTAWAWGWAWDVPGGGRAGARCGDYALCGLDHQTLECRLWEDSSPAVEELDDFCTGFALGGLADTVKSEAVLPAYLIGLALAPVFLKDRELMHRTRVIAFTILTPFYFLKAGSLIRADVLVTSAGLIVLYLGVKIVTKFFGILPLTRIFRFDPKEGMYTTLLMSTGLTFGSISALFGLTNQIIDERQYTILLTAVIGSAVVPTMIAQRWFQPNFKPLAGPPAIGVEATATAEGS
jgi:hypothetical protein